mgnify:CR=1 FL=1
MLLFSCGNVTPKHEYRIIYEFENIEKVSANDKHGTVQTLNNRLDKIASDIEVKLNNKQQIEVKLSTDFELERLNAIITNRGKLEFWECIKIDEIDYFFIEANAVFKTEKDTLNPFFDLMEYRGYYNGELFSVAVKDTSLMRTYLNKKEVKSLLKGEFRYTKFLFGKPDIDNNVPLFAVKSNKGNKAYVNQTHITNARQSYSQTNRPTITMQMNSQGANRWERMTEIAYQQGSQIAITLNGIVYSAPSVSVGAIKGGNTELSGDFTLEEAQDLAYILSANKSIPKLKFVNASAIND